MKKFGITLIFGAVIIAALFFLWKKNSSEVARTEKREGKESDVAQIGPDPASRKAQTTSPAKPVSFQRKVTNESQNASSAPSMEEFLKKHDPEGEWKVSRTSDGRVIAASGGMIRNVRNSPEQNLQFVEEFNQTLGVPVNSMVPSSVQHDENPYSRIEQFDQKFGEYEVFGAYTKVFRRAADDSIFYIANETRPVGDVDLRIKYSLQDVREIVLQSYSGKTVTIESSPGKPVVYAPTPGQGELTWQITLRVDRPLFDRRHLLVSASTGKIVKDTTLVKY